MSTPGRLFGILALLAALASAGCRETDRPWPPGVQPVAEESPALPPDRAIQTLVAPPGFRVELVAAEPMIEDPVAIDIDPDGRIWVVEMRGYMPSVDARGEREPVGRITVLEDTDDDGRADRRTVFLDGLVLPRSIKVLEHGVLIIEPPNLWLARDTNGDLRSDTKERIRGDYGRPNGNPEHTANSLMWGFDNWIASSEHAGEVRLRGGRWEHRPTLSRGQWGVTMDDVGRVYRNFNDDPLRVDHLASHYYARNPGLVRTRGLYEPATTDTEVFPIRMNRGVNRGYREGTLRPDGSLAVWSAAGSPVVYRGDRLPSDLAGNVFVTEPAGNLVRRFVVTTGANGQVRAQNAYDRAEFLSSTDERFRPVNLYSAPDGTLYVVDMYRGVIQHGAYQTEYLKNHIRSHSLVQPIHYGRLYRIVHVSTRREARPSLSRRTTAQLVEVLRHPNGWWRDTAQRLLVERGDRSAAGALRDLQAQSADVRTRLHAFWTLEGLDALDVAAVRQALDDRAPDMRAAGIRAAERWLASGDAAVEAAVRARIDDPSPLVIRQLAASLGALASGTREDAIVALIQRHGDDPIVVDAAVSGLSGSELAVLERLLTPASEPRPDAVTTLVGTLIRAKQGDPIQTVLGRIAELDRPVWQRTALLAGFESRRPGAIEESFGLPRAAPIALPARPGSFLALVRSKDPAIAKPVGRVVARLDWPGKPKSEVAPAPLSAAEQERFAAGQQIYAAMCVPCHQVDGRGHEGLAPSLVGSKWALGRPGYAARIVLNGKEGTALMPPLGTLSDEEIAAVLTYVRRAWGQGASPVDPLLVREARGASTGRTRPWTDEELAKVTQPDGLPSR